MSGPIGRTLWSADADYPDGTPVRFRIVATPEGLAVVHDLPGGEYSGIELPRESVQELRHAITGWLVDAAPQVAS